MKYVYFNNLKIKNFLSIGNDEVLINFNKGLNIITGINRDKEDRRNGVGKSAIADALYFSIFGTTLRELKKSFISNNLNTKTCEVQLNVTVKDPKHGENTFDIVRTLNPSKCYIFKNGEDITRDSIQNTNEYIQEILSSSPEVFQNCVIMSLNNHIPFMAKSKIDKRKFIEQIFNLDVFSRMLKQAREEYNSVKKDFDIQITKNEEKIKHLKIYEDQKLNFDNSKKTKIQDIKKIIDKNENKILDYKKQIEEIQKDNSEEILNEKLKKLNKHYQEKKDNLNITQEKLYEIKNSLQNSKDKFEKIGTNEDKCPVCLKPVEEHDKQNIESEKKLLLDTINELQAGGSNLKEQLQQLNESISKCEKGINKVKDNINESKANKARLADLKGVINQLQEQIKDNYAQIEQVNKETDTFDKVINECKSELDEIKKQLEDNKNTINLLDAVKFIVSEEGVKSFIVKKILNQFNSKLAYYLKKLDSNSICLFDEYFEEEIVNEKGKTCQYTNFSGAERKAIDLACLFSFMDIRQAQGDVHYNVSFYDELFDSSLDEKGVGLVIDILNERVNKFNECAMIISHRKESIKEANGEIIFLEKQNGITKKIDYID